MNLCRLVREGSGQSLESSSTCCGHVGKPPLGFSSSPGLSLLSGFTVSLWDRGRRRPTTHTVISPLLCSGPALPFGGRLILPCACCLPGRAAALASAGAGLAPRPPLGMEVERDRVAVPPPHRPPTAGQAPHLSTALAPGLHCHTPCLSSRGADPCTLGAEPGLEALPLLLLHVLAQSCSHSQPRPSWDPLKSIA